MTPEIRAATGAFMLAALVGCGGDGSEPPVKAFDETAASTAISHFQAQPIRHDFTEAGTYTLTLTGNYAGPSDTLQVWFSFSGQGTTEGNATPSYTVAAQPVAVNQTLHVTLTGAGPWQMLIESQLVGDTTGTLTNLKLHGVQN
jgi:hypothetical protein